MPPLFKSDKDPEGTAIRLDAGFRGKNGTHYLMLTRLPPYYPKPPTFIAELSKDAIELRSGERSAVHYRAYAIQDFSPKELTFLRDAKPGKASLPLFGASAYPAIARTLGNPFYKLEDKELPAVAETGKLWKLVGGQR